MRMSALMILMAVLLIAADDPKKGAAKDKDAMQGTWELVGGEVGGKKLPEEQLKQGKLVISGDQYAVTLADRGTQKGTQKLDPTKKPKTVDVTDATGPDKGKTLLGIYELAEGEYKICLAPPGKDRPTKFVSDPASGQWVHVWKRVKK